VYRFHYSCQILKKLNRFSKNRQISHVIKIRPVTAELFHADRQPDGFRNLANASKRGGYTSHRQHGDIKSISFLVKNKRKLKMSIKLSVIKLVYKTNINQVYTHNIHGTVIYISCYDLVFSLMMAFIAETCC
jgi:hypothetical protein